MTRNLPKTAILALLATLVLAALATAACGGDDDPGVVVIGPDEPIEVRTMLALTGAPTFGEPLRAAIEMAVADFGPVHGHEVELGPPVDSMCSREGGRAAAREVIADERVLGVVGTSCSVSAVAVSPVLSVAGLVMVAPANSSPALTSDLAGNPGPSYHEGYFRVSRNDLHQAKAVAGFAHGELGLRRMVAVHDGDPYTSALARAFRDEFRARDGVVPAMGVIEKGQTGMREMLRELANAEPDGVFFPLFRAEAEPFVMQLREVPRLEGVTLVSGSAPVTARFLALPETEGLYFAAPAPAESGNRNSATGKTVDEAFAALAAAHPDLAHVTPYWAYAYDAATLLLAAVEHAAVPGDGSFFGRLLGFDRGGTLRVHRGALREAVRTVSSGMSGLTGVLSCDEFGDCAQGSQVIYHHADASVTDPAELPVVHRVIP